MSPCQDTIDMTVSFTPTCDCGWTGTPVATQGRAANAVRQHSCEKFIRRSAETQRGKERAAQVDRTPQPCRHEQASHVHGERACYVHDKCRCYPCSAANTASVQRATRTKAYGRWDNLVDAGPAREHIMTLTAQGMGRHRIVAVSDISDGMLWKLLYGKRGKDGTRRPTKRVTKAVNDRILAVRLDRALGARVPGIGSTRRLQALVSIGWSQARLATKLGVTGTNLLGLIHGRRDTTVARALAVAALYDELWCTPPPHSEGADLRSFTRSIRYAQDAHWAPPLTWDGEDIDDPDAVPNGGDEVEHHGPVTQVTMENIEWLLDQHPFTLPQLAHRLGVTRDAIEHACPRHNRRDLLERMDRNQLVREMAS